MYSHLNIDAAPLGRLLVGLGDEDVVFAHLARSEKDLNRLLGEESARFTAMKPAGEDHPVADFLRAYLNGEDVDPIEIPVRFTRGSEFQQRVWRSLRRVKRGRLVTYGRLAAEVGNPSAARAVGGAVGRNPLVLFVPCHRVVAAGGGIGGFSAGLDAKRHWLCLEGVSDIRLSGRMHEYSR